MFKKQKGYTSFSLIILALWGLAAVGWVLNIVEIFKMVNDPLTGMLILRAVGIFVAPLGAILGYL
jgi:hypothetical protein